MLWSHLSLYWTQAQCIQNLRLPSVDTMEVDATPQKSEFESHTQLPQLCFVSRMMSLTSILGGTRSLTSTLGVGKEYETGLGQASKPLKSPFA